MRLWLGIYGERLGLTLIVWVSISDLAMIGLRHFVEYSIGWKGIGVIWIGVAMILCSKHIDRKLK